MAFTYAILNSGYDANTVEQDLKKAVADAATKAAGKGSTAGGTAVCGPVCGEIASVIGTQAATWLVGKLEGIIFANCDGSVAAGEHLYTETLLAKATAGGKVVSATDDNKGTDSPTGCGSNSRYYVTWSISGHPKPPLAVKR